MSVIDYSTIDAGVRNEVRRLHDAGLTTTDSGDGSKAPEMGCALSFPNISIVTTRETGVEDLERALEVLGGAWRAELSWAPGEPWLIFCHLDEDGGGWVLADKSKIEWTDATWNPTVGCSRVSEGCRK